MEDQAKIPVTVITGFLGAGKTTLLNHLIVEHPDKKFAIIENEFGEISFDNELIINVDNSNIYELPNGCICCALNDDLSGILKDLLNSGKTFSHLLVETTGIADPSTVFEIFFSNREIEAGYTMDSVICLVDAIHFEASLQDREEVLKQVTISDILLLNKVDGADPESLERINNQLRKLNPHNRIIRTTHAQVNEPDILNARAYMSDRIEAFTLEKGVDVHSISSYTYVFEGDFDLERFSFWIEYFLFINQSSIFRVKGILSFCDNPRRMILQSIRSSYRLEEGAPWMPAEKRINRLVSMGKDLAGNEINEALESLMN